MKPMNFRNTSTIVNSQIRCKRDIGNIKGKN